MVLQGADLVMLGGTHLPGELDETTGQHSQDMIQKGSQMIQDAVNGPAMEKIHAAAPLYMAETHLLGEAMLGVISQFEQMARSDRSSDQAMATHHIHMLLNHVAQMATQGADLVMLGGMGMAGSADTASVDLGRHMISEATAVLNEVIEGESMQQLHLQKETNSEGMASIHELGEKIMTVIDLLSKIHSEGHPH